MNTTYILTEILAIYKCTYCNQTLSKGHERSTFFPNSFLKLCPNQKCVSRTMPEPLELDESEVEVENNGLV